MGSALILIDVIDVSCCFYPGYFHLEAKLDSNFTQSLAVDAFLSHCSSTMSFVDLTLPLKVFTLESF